MILKKRNNRNIFNPSRKWKNLFLQRLLKDSMFSEIYEKETVISIIQLLITLYIESNIPIIEKNIIDKNIKKLEKFRENIPIDYDVVDYATIIVIEIETDNNLYDLIIIEDEQFKESKVHTIIKRGKENDLKSLFQSYTIVFP